MHRVRLRLKQFLYSKWFFLFLAIVSIIDFCADVGEQIWGWTGLNWLSIAMDVFSVWLTLWIFIDLVRRRPKSDVDRIDRRR
jgi:hypothetical protein